MHARQKALSIVWMSIAVGLAGVKHDASVALATDGRVLAAAPQERITRVRSAGFGSSGFPDDVLDVLLSYTAHKRGDVSAYAVAEDAPLPGLPVSRIEHHRSHAMASFLPSPYASAVVVVCDQDGPEVSVWNGSGEDVTRVDWTWHGPGPARVHSECARILGFSSGGADQRMDAAARLATGHRDARADALMTFAGDRLRLAPDWQDALIAWSREAGQAFGSVASAVQSRLADIIIALLADVKTRFPEQTRVCLGGSLFYSSFINTAVKRAGVFDEVFLPIHPGNAGLAIGNALFASGGGRTAVSPFLGPSYTSEDVKAALDNCKLTYKWVSEDEAIAAAVKDLRNGRLVAWFDGRMEWGPRALGARSILANPFAPYALENLNRFLKQREPWRGYALSGLAPAVAEHFDGPAASPFMECDYVPRDPKRFEHILPAPAAGVRVQTVGDDLELPRFRKLLEAFGDAAGAPILVNTSFNGFREPIVCSPRDAVRVFYGTGLDTLVIGQFIIRK